ncbi:MAG: ABC transporter C-terminal domain-containing protein, partial [Bacteroidota bacterium]
KQRRNRIKKLQREQERVESAIAELEEKLGALHLKMAEPAVAADYNKLSEVQEEVQKVEAKTAALHEEWESVLMELEELEEG